MLHMTWTVYYCGHGAMNYIEVMDENDVVVQKILVDAGTTQDDIENEAEQSFNRMQARLLSPNKRGENVWIWICITHYHEDHYSYIHRLFGVLQIYENVTVYLGSLGDGRLHDCMNETETFFANIWNNWRDSVCILGVTQPQPLWIEQNIELYILWNNLCSQTNDYNDNSAAFLVRDTHLHMAYVFLGDMTGCTFLALDQMPELLEEVNELLKGYQKGITVPHHGSLHTLQYQKFITVDKSGNFLEPLKRQMHKMGMDQSVYFISNGLDDCHGHPDYMTASAFRDMAVKAAEQDTISGYTTFAYSDQLPENEWCYIHKNGAKIYATARKNGAEFWSVCSYSTGAGALRSDDRKQASFLETKAAKCVRRCDARQPVSAAKPVKELKSAGAEDTFSALFGPMGSMVYYENGLLREGDVLGDVKLLDCRREQEHFQGVLEVRDTSLALYQELLQGIQMKGTYKEGVLYAEAPVSKWTPSFSRLPVREQERVVVFRSFKGRRHGVERQCSEVFLECRGTMGRQSPVSAAIQYQLLQGTQAVEAYTVVFGDGKGLFCSDIAAQLSDLLGIKMDLLDYFPSEVPFAVSMALEQIFIQKYVHAQTGGEERMRLCVTCGYGPQEWQADNGRFALDDIKFAFGFYHDSKKCRLNSVSVQAQFTLFGQSFAVTAAYPSYQISFSNRTGSSISLAEAASVFGASILPGMEHAAITHIWYEGNLDFSQFQLRCRLDSVYRASLSDSGTIVWDKLAFAASHDSRGSRCQIEGGIAFFWKEEELVRFRCAAHLSKQALLLEGKLLTASGTFPAFYQAVSGQQLPDGFAEITIISAEVCAEYTDVLSLKNYQMEIQVSVSDTAVFGAAFQMKASLQGTGNGFELKGSFLLEDCFTIYAALSVQAGKAAWKFGLRFAGIVLELSYQAAPRRRVIGVIQSDLTLRDAVSYLVALLDPKKSYAASADWKLLDAVSLKNTQVAYDYDRKELELSVSPALSLPFAKVDQLWITMGSKGVTFRMAGQFLGEDYTQEKPLTWDEEGPPATSGELLHVNYLLLAEGIQVQLPDTVSTEEALRLLERQIPPNDVPAALVRNPAAGFLGGLDLLAADTVRIQMLYNDCQPFYGAAFELYGDKAGVLKGLRAEVSYTRLTDQSGVFSGSIVPPKELRSIRMGAVTLGIGRIRASVYTNGNFQIDLGYPAQRDYTHSFQLTYGVFEGFGGIYVKKGITKDLELPATDKGYFSPVLALGIGMRLQLRQEVKAGPLSACASLVMQGTFEGVYATYLPYGSSKADAYYRADAQISFDGKLQGSVDFGIIGVSVMASVHAKSRLRIEAYRPVQAEVSLYVEAGASVKVLFCRLRFHFALNFGITFVLDRGGKAPWLQDGYAREGMRMESDGPDPLPEKLSYHKTGKMGNAKTVIALHAVLFYGIADGRYFSVLAGMVSREDFAKIADKIAQTASASGYLCRTDGEELFRRQRFFRSQDWLYEFLEHYFVLQLDFCTEGLKEDGVVMPLPDGVAITFEEHLTNGDVRSVAWNLWEYFRTGADFKQQMEEYYADTMWVPKDAPESVYAVQKDTASLAAWMFADYFELVLKAVRAEKENSKRQNRSFDACCFSDEQLTNMIGMASRFLLGGKRGPVKAGTGEGSRTLWRMTGNKAGQDQTAQGLWSLAGLQIGLEHWEQTKQYCYKISLAPASAGWLALAGHAAEISLEVTAQQAKDQFPAAAFPASVFAGEPAWMDSWQQVTVNQLCVEQMLTIKGQGLSYYRTGEGFREDVRYRMAGEDGGGNIRFGLLVCVRLQKCRNAGAVYQVAGGSDFFLLDMALRQEVQGSVGSVIEEALFLYPAGHQDHTYEIYPGAGCIQLQGRGQREADRACCPIENTVAFARMLAEAGLQGDGNYLCFADDCPFGTEQLQEVYFVLHWNEGQAYQTYFNCIAAKTDQPSLVLQGDGKALRAVLPQGTAGITVTLDDSGLKDKEQLLAMQYQNLALEVEDAVSHNISHETMPFMQEDFGDQKTCSLAVSYARALEGSQAEVYHFVTQQRQLIFRLLWIDIFGNRMPAGKELCMVPKYTDRLIAVHNYPGVDTSYQIKTEQGVRRLAVTFHYGAKTRQDTGIWQAARAQLLQKDVRLQIYSGLLEQAVVLEKERLAGFLNQCIQAPEQEASLTYLAVIKKPHNGAEWMDMHTALYLSRNRLYVDPKAPDEAAVVHSDLVWQNSETALQNSYFFAGDRNMLLLAIDKEPVYSLEKTACYAWQRLPAVTGCFTGKDGAAELAAYDLQDTLEMFLEDFAYVHTPRALELMCRQDVQLTLLKRVYQLRIQAAEAMACRIFPLDPSACGTDRKLTAVRQYVKRRLWENPGQRIREVLFLFVSGTSAFLETASKKRWKGQMGGCLDYPLEIKADTASAEAVGGIDASVLEEPEKLYLELESLWDEKQRSYTPANGAYSFQRCRIPGLDQICLPAAGIPKPPVYRRKEVLDHGYAFVAALRPLVQDTVYLWYSKAKLYGAPEQNEPICAMYRYAQISCGISDKTSIEGIQAMIPAMEEYVKALGELKDRPHDQEPEQKLYFLPEEGLGHWKAVQMAVMDERLTLACCYGTKDWYEMEQNGGRFYFAKEEPPVYGDEIQLKIRYTGEDASVSACRLCMVREQPAGTKAYHHRFYSWSPEILF